MLQRRPRQRGDVIGGHREPAVQDRARLGGEDQELRGARAGAPRRRPRARTAARSARSAAWRARGATAYLHHVIRGRHAAHQLLELEDPLRRQHAHELGPVIARLLADDLLLLGLARVVDVDLEHEAIELRLGQRIGALLLDRVLGGEHEERQRQLVRGAAGRHAVLLHRLQERGLRLGRRAVDLVGEHEVREHRALDELEHAAAGGVVLLEDLGAGDVRRHEVRRELDALERQVQRLGQRAR